MCIHSCLTIQTYTDTREEKELSTEQGLAVSRSELPESPGQSSEGESLSEEEGKDQRIKVVQSQGGHQYMGLAFVCGSQFTAVPNSFTRYTVCRDTYCSTSEVLFLSCSFS